MRIYIREEERYPVYEIDPEPAEGEDSWAALPFDVPDEVVARWNDLWASYDALQVEMKAIRKQAEDAYKKRHTVAWREHLSKEFNISLEQV